MDRVFLDANVLFSAAYREDAGLARLWKLPDAVLVTSTYALAEARRNLETAEQLGRLTRLVERVELVAEPGNAGAVSVTIDLPKDDVPILQAAMASGCSHLLSGDRRAFGPHYGAQVEGILILRPAEYLRSRGAGPGGDRMG